MKTLCSIAMFTTLILAGCESQKEEKTFFDGAGAPTRAIADRQAAVGARRDAMLYAPHFSGPALNSLGRQKLADMLRDGDGGLPINVWVNLKATDPLAAERRKAVGEYFADIGLKPEQFKVEVGPNPDAMHEVAPLIAAKAKLEAADAEAGLTPPKPAAK